MRGDLVGRETAVGVERVEAGEAREHPEHVRGLVDGDIRSELVLFGETVREVLHAAPSAFLEARDRAADGLRVERRHREERVRDVADRGIDGDAGAHAAA